MRIATFNVQNMRLRHEDGHAHLDGARDRDAPADTVPGAERLDPIDRRLTAAVLRDVDADVVALQEVFDSETLDHFHENYLRPTGTAPYPWRHCLPGNDGAGLNVALMSRRPVDELASHAALRPSDLGLEVPPGVDPDLPVFRRDCLMAVIGGLTLWICHFKAPSPDPQAAWPVRRIEALAVRRLIERRYTAPARALWLIIGDLNESLPASEAGEQAIAPLKGGFSIDLLERLPQEKRWTYHDTRSGRYTRPDAMLASPALAERWPQARPWLVREGLGRESARYRGPRLAGVGTHRPHASDHAALAIDLEGL